MFIENSYCELPADYVRPDRRRSVSTGDLRAAPKHRNSVSRRPDPSLFRIPEAEEEPPVITTAGDAMTVFAKRIDHMKPIYEPMSKFQGVVHMCGMCHICTAQLSDVFITAFPTCGTVWVQHIMHQLRTRGVSTSTEYDEISNVVPYVTTNNVRSRACTSTICAGTW
jgi:hypothetical protein